MRSLFIDRTIVKGYHENVYTDDGKVSVSSIFPFTMDVYMELGAQTITEEQVSAIDASLAQEAVLMLFM